jgi:hypothetical protein
MDEFLISHVYNVFKIIRIVIKLCHNSFDMKIKSLRFGVDVEKLL